MNNDKNPDQVPLCQLKAANDEISIETPLCNGMCKILTFTPVRAIKGLDRLLKQDCEVMIPALEL